MEAEKELKTTLTKPHPYTFLKAMCGTDYDNKRIIDDDYDKSKLKTTLVVGDAGADILAAKAMGASCILCSAGHQSVERLTATGCPVIDDLNQVPETLAKIL